jgi:hypothetical protein
MSQLSSSLYLVMLHIHIGCPIYINTSLCIYRIANMTYGSCGYSSGCGTDYGSVRSYLTREEKVSKLKEYKDDLEKEVQGVNERIKELENK